MRKITGENQNSSTKLEKSLRCELRYRDKLQRRIISLLCTFLCMCIGSFAFSGCGRKEEIYLNSSNSEEIKLTEESTMSETRHDVCVVYVCGQVQSPGVYVLPLDARANDAIQAAGGLLETAALQAINLAEAICDGQKIYVPSLEEVKSGTFMTDSTMQDISDGKVNLNTATKEELMSIPGIGEAKANQIIQYRSKQGNFQSPEDIMNIPGIKEGMYAKIKESIKVK